MKHWMGVTRARTTHKVGVSPFDLSKPHRCMSGARRCSMDFRFCRELLLHQRLHLCGGAAIRAPLGHLGHLGHLPAHKNRCSLGISAALTASAMI